MMVETIHLALGGSAFGSVKALVSELPNCAAIALRDSLSIGQAPRAPNAFDECAYFSRHSAY